MIRLVKSSREASVLAADAEQRSGDTWMGATVRDSTFMCFLQEKPPNLI